MPFHPSEPEFAPEPRHTCHASVAVRPGRKHSANTVATPSGPLTAAPLAALARVVAAILALGGAWACGDCFFSIKGHLVECGTSTPIANATISVRTDQGLHEGTYAKTFATDDSGNFEVTNDATEACGAVQTLTFTKDGFSPMSTQVTGAADAPPIQLCMSRNPAP